MQNITCKSAAVLAGFLTVTTLFTGCATTSSESQSYTTYAKAPQFLESEIGRMLEQASSGQQLSFNQSPWGADISAQVTNSYFSAAGRQCLELWLNTTSEKAIVCRYDKQQWAVSRALTVAYLPKE